MTSVWNFSYTGSNQSVQLPSGCYKLEVWGAQGGGRDLEPNNTELGYGGKGGYSVGILCILEKTTLYAFVGGQGGIATTYQGQIAPGGFNGGALSYCDPRATSDPGSGGGGASDFRINSPSLYARVIVAGGGGGGGEDGDPGGFGGGIVSGAGNNYAAGQTSPGHGSQFGHGAYSCISGGKAGGGWYGGGSTNGTTTQCKTPQSSGDLDGGSGGSGYVYTRSTAHYYPQGCLLNPDYYLFEAKTIDGNQTFLDPYGIERIGNAGNGYARITKLNRTHWKFQFNNEINLLRFFLSLNPICINFNSK